MSEGYQKRDFEIIDYELHQVEGIPQPLRGPAPGKLEPDQFIACVGAAQTFGCYVPRPFPAQIGEALGLPPLNLGLAGAGPRRFLSNPAFLKWINHSRFAVVQVMSGRSVSNSIFESRGGEMLEHRETGEKLGAAPSYEKLLRSMSQRDFDSLLIETRARWVADNAELLRKITVPKVLLWFSVRPPRYEVDHRNVLKAFGEFPQLIQPEDLEPLKTIVDDYVEVVSSKGLPQRLVSRFTGKKTSITMRADLGGRQKPKNDYYPSPEMHDAAFAALLPACRALVSR